MNIVEILLNQKPDFNQYSRVQPTFRRVVPSGTPTPAQLLR